MGGRFVGILIRRERLRKNWSQEGLCRGICAVSYLSKIERGKTDADREIIRLLLRRLGVEWGFGEAAEARQLADRMYEAFFALDRADLRAAERRMDEDWEALAHGPCLPDFLLFRAVSAKTAAPPLREFAEGFDERQQVLWLLLQKKYDELLLRFPSARAYLEAGIAAYESGNYPTALERLQRSYDLAATRGYAFLLLESQVFLGNCYSNTMQFDRMLEHFRIAERLASALGDRDTLDTIRYNTQATNLEMGRVQESYAYFSRLENPSAMALHKLAVCCEKLGSPGEAAAALDRAEAAAGDSPGADLTREMCGLVRYRLGHPGYLGESAYGSMLLSCFGHIRKRLPIGYAQFHLPWVAEWYAGTRQYKQAFELLADFPYFGRFPHP